MIAVFTLYKTTWTHQNKTKLKCMNVMETTRSWLVAVWRYNYYAFLFFIDFCDLFFLLMNKKRKPQGKCWSYRCCFMFPFDRKDGKEPFSCLRTVKFIAIAVFHSFEMWNSSSRGIAWYVLLCMHWFCLRTSLLFFNQSCQLKESVLIPLNL